MDSRSESPEAFGFGGLVTPTGSLSSFPGLYPRTDVINGGGGVKYNGYAHEGRMDDRATPSPLDKRGSEHDSAFSDVSGRLSYTALSPAGEALDRALSGVVDSSAPSLRAVGEAGNDDQLSDDEGCFGFDSFDMDEDHDENEGSETEEQHHPVNLHSGGGRVFASTKEEDTDIHQINSTSSSRRPSLKSNGSSRRPSLKSNGSSRRPSLKSNGSSRRPSVNGHASEHSALNPQSPPPLPPRASATGSTSMPVHASTETAWGLHRTPPTSLWQAHAADPPPPIQAASPPLSAPLHPWWHHGGRRKAATVSAHNREDRDSNGVHWLVASRRRSEQRALRAAEKRQQREQQKEQAAREAENLRRLKQHGEELIGRIGRSTSLSDRSVPSSMPGVAFGSRPMSPAPDMPPTRKSAPVDFSLLQSTMQDMRSSPPLSRSAPSEPTRHIKERYQPTPYTTPPASQSSRRTSSSVLKDSIFQTVDEILEMGATGHELYEDIEKRAIEAATWTNNSIRDLIKEIKTHGGNNNSVQFGVLFNATANKFDALAGLLKTAKKYKVIAYEGEQLWQRVHDDVVISLLQHDFPGIKIRRRLKSDVDVVTAESRSSLWGNSFRPGERCASPSCNRIVYQADYVSAGGKQYCRSCFRCASCDKVLKQSDYSVSRDMQHRCGKCHRDYEMSAF